MRKALQFIQPFIQKQNNVSWAQLGLLRIGVMSLLLAFSNYASPSGFANFASSATCLKNMGLWLNIELTGDDLRHLHLTYQVALALSAVGLFTRPAIWVSFLTTFAMNAYALKFCYTNHSNLPTIAFLGIWSLFDRGSGWRLENILFRSYRRRAGLPKDNEAGEMLFALKLFFCVIFFSAGVTKLRMSGLEWIWSDNLWRLLAMQNYFYENSTPRQLFLEFNAFLIRNPKLCPILALDVVLIELVAPLALFRKSWVKWIVPHLLLMQVGVYIFFYVDFRVWLALYPIWINYEPVDRWLSRFRKIWVKT